jgi:CelD/BcsL family acetyltransferase involved in cellulose biosynthesis
MAEITTTYKEDEWRKFLESDRSATVFHTPEWKQFLEETFNYQPRYLFARDEHGSIIGLLPLYVVKSMLTGSRLCSAPLSHDCGYIGDIKALDGIIAGALEMYGHMGLDYFEVRSPVSYPGFQSHNYYSTYTLPLSSNVEAVTKKMHKRIRRGISKARDSGVIVSASSGPEDVKAFYELNCLSKKELGVPCHSLKFFLNLFRYLKGNARLYIARHGEDVIGGGVMEQFNGKVIYGYGAASPGSLKLFPYYAFLWKSIEDACLAGQSQYDFGRASYENPGLVDFKLSWGSEEKKLFYSYYPKNPRSLVNNRNGLKFEVASKMIMNMPTPLYKVFSNTVFSNFG